MKKILLYLLALAPMAAFAQLTSGYYRVQNIKTERYISIVDTRASISGTGKIDLRAIHMLKPFEDSVAYNPATICYVKLEGNNQCDLIGQGLVMSSQIGGRLLNYLEISNNVYQFFGKVSTSGASATKYLGDESYEEWGAEYIVYYPNDNGANPNWHVWPVDQSEHYFGVKPEITATADNSYWSTMYAGFPFKASAATTKIYRVSKVDNDFGVAVITEITSDVPAQTPVLLRCTGATPSDNKLTLLDPNTSATIGDNYLNGNYYCNDVAESTGHRNVKAYNASTMRMLGVDADGKPAFVKSNIQYLPANKCYLAVNASTAPDVLKIMTEAEYETYVTGIEQITTSTTDGTKVVYDLQGRRVQAPSKGLYIVNGKKMIIR